MVVFFLFLLLAALGGIGCLRGGEGLFKPVNRRAPNELSVASRNTLIPSESDHLLSSRRNTGVEARRLILRGGVEGCEDGGQIFVHQICDCDCRITLTNVGVCEAL